MAPNTTHPLSAWEPPVTEFAKPVIVCAPDTIDAAQRVQLENAGYVVIESASPDRVQILHPILVPPAGDVIVPALLHAIGYSEAAVREFGKSVIAALKKKA
jgi:hypothetical protein